MIMSAIVETITKATDTNHGVRYLPKTNNATLGKKTASANKLAKVPKLIQVQTHQTNHKAISNRKSFLLGSSKTINMYTIASPAMMLGENSMILS